MKAKIFFIFLMAGLFFTGSGLRAQDNAMAVYNNYDFVPGDKIIFEDNFTIDPDGEFPAHWELNRGQAVKNKYGGRDVMMLYDGNPLVTPRMKNKPYLGDAFTIEYDFYAYHDISAKSKAQNITCGFMDENWGVVVRQDGYTESLNLGGNYPEKITPEAFENKWHHVAIAYKDGQYKVYLDQYRTLVNPSVNFTKYRKPGIVTFKCVAQAQNKNFGIYTNVRIASGGGMNMIGKKFTDSKIITHGINFDYNKATLKPESMGTLNMIKKVMDENPDVKFEVGGHTDGDGDGAYNMTLSQQRSEAVRAKLVSMGIDPSRLTSKGFGKTKPIADNSTDEGKANNRRVEFVKK